MKQAGRYWVPDEEEVQLDALAAGGWQLDHLEKALSFVKRRRIAVDGGAHIGSWTMRLAEEFEQVWAFEPSPPTHECLIKNLSEWAREHPDRDVFLACHKVALGNGESLMAMGEDGKYSNGGNTGGRYLIKQKGGTIPVRTLDSYGLPGLDFLKLDVEGFELFALRGARRTILEHRPVIMIEVKHRMAARYDLSASAAGRLLIKLGMEKAAIVGSDEVWIWR